MEGCDCLSRPLGLALRCLRSQDARCRNSGEVFLNEFGLVQAVKVLTRMILLGMVIIMDVQLDLKDFGQGLIDHGEHVGLSFT